MIACVGCAHSSVTCVGLMCCCWRLLLQKRLGGHVMDQINVAAFSQQRPGFDLPSASSVLGNTRKRSAEVVSGNVVAEGGPLKRRPAVVTACMFFWSPVHPPQRISYLMRLNNVLSFI